MNENDDYALALQLQEQFYREANEGATDFHAGEPTATIMDGGFSASGFASGTGSRPSTSDGAKDMSIIDGRWELIDPNPDVRGLFLEFNDKYFWGKLDGVEVRWSPRMTLCAGLCCYEGYGGLCSVRLSQPLLKLRPRKDLVETLLCCLLCQHEMIHAYLFVTQNNRDHDAHGPEFHKHMYRINKATGTKISVYHTFHDEVDSYRTHWWRCDGPCKDRKPYFGFVKRAMNRAPSARDPWWPDHQRTCGGTYHKVKEPEGYGQKKRGKKDDKEKKAPEVPKGVRDIRSMFAGIGKTGGDKKPSATVSSSSGNKKGKEESKPTVPDLPRLPSLELNPSSATSTSRNSELDSSVTPAQDLNPAVQFPGQGRTLGTSSGTNDIRYRRIPGCDFGPISTSSTSEATNSKGRDMNSNQSTTCDTKTSDNSSQLNAEKDSVMEKKGAFYPWTDSEDSFSDASEDSLILVSPSKRTNYGEAAQAGPQRKIDPTPPKLKPNLNSRHSMSDSDSDFEPVLKSDKLQFASGGKWPLQKKLPGIKSVSNPDVTCKKKTQHTADFGQGRNRRALIDSDSESDTDINESKTLGSVSRKRKLHDIEEITDTTCTDEQTGKKSRLSTSPTITDFFDKHRRKGDENPEGTSKTAGNLSFKNEASVVFPPRDANLNVMQNSDPLQTCPVCTAQVRASTINDHLDQCLQL